MLHGRSRSAALMAVLSLVLTAPFQRGRDCDVCPTDCPMHAARKAPARPVGCHHGSATARPAHPVNEGACAMRSACGHHGAAALPVFEAELPPALVIVPVEGQRYAARPDGPLQVADCPAPPDRPPKSCVV